MKTLYCGFIAVACLLSACASPNSTDTAVASTATEDGSATNYVKPGASITFSHTAEAKTAVSETGHLKIDVSERYDSGMIKIAATGSEGLEIFPTSASATFDATDATNHDLDVYYSANTDGKYYVNLVATAPDGQVRTHAIGVIVGDPSMASDKPSDMVITTDADGNPIIVMDADEDIQ